MIQPSNYNDREENPLQEVERILRECPCAIEDIFTKTRGPLTALGTLVFPLPPNEFEPHKPDIEIPCEYFDEHLEGHTLISYKSACPCGKEINFFNNSKTK